MTDAAEKVCVVPYRTGRTGPEVLAFHHPLAGRQFVKGTLEIGELPQDGARRELREESGLSLVTAPVPLGQERMGSPALTWFFYAFATSSLPDAWDHWTEDDGGHLLSFFWHPLSLDLNGEWHPIFHQAFRVIRRELPRGVPLLRDAGRSPA